MEVALGIVGAVGVLGQLLDGCLKAYKVFTTASNLGRDSERMMCKIRIEEMRLAVWGREWGVAEGKFEERLSRPNTANDGLKSLAEMILKELYRTIMDLNKLQDKYGLREETPGSVDKEAYKSSADPSSMIKASVGKVGGAGMKLRAKWVIQDKEKFGVFLDDLSFYNDRLDKLFPPARVASLQRTWASEMLQSAEQDLEKLNILEAASQPHYPGLSAFAELKKLRINLDAKEPNKKILSSSELKIPKWRIQYQQNDIRDVSRCHATYQKPIDTLRGESVSEDVDVFVEWTHFDPAMAMDERLSIYQKVDNLARMLHSSSNKHPDLHTLDCLGYVEDTKKCCYGMVYWGPPATSIQSLSTLLSSAPSPDLDIRFKLAHTISIALWSCHSLDWLHKSLCPNNILFFGQPHGQNQPGASAPGTPRPELLRRVSSKDSNGGVGTPSDSSAGAAAAAVTNNPEILSKAYLAGFDSSRPDHVEEMSIASRNLAGEDLYRHPASLGPHRRQYRKAFDIYSLGLLLLEIGLWKGLEMFHRGKYSKYTPEAFRAKIINSLVPTLGAKVGSSYKLVVQRCLCYEDPELTAVREKEDSMMDTQSQEKTDESVSATPHQMLEWAVQTLENLQV